MKPVRRLAPTLLLLLWGLALAACREGYPAGDEPTHAHPAGESAEVTALPPAARARAGILTAPAAPRRLRTELETTGTIDFDQRRHAHVSPRVGGHVGEVLVDLGDRVAAGQVLARLDSLELGQAVVEFLQARARTELARETFEREERLWRERVSSEQELVATRAELREAEAARQGAEERLHLFGLSHEEIARLDYDQARTSCYAVRAPFAGTIVAQEVTRGELVGPERVLFQIADLSRVWAWIDVFERDLARVHRGDHVVLEVDAWPGVSFTGEVSDLGTSVQSETRAARARLAVPNPDGKLRPGMFARVRILDPHGADGDTLAPEVLAVPEGAIQRAGSETVVYVALDEGRFSRRPVTLGRRGEGYVEVLSGLAAGEEVVIEGAFFVKSELAREELGGGHSH